MANHELDTDSLLRVEIRPDELAILLERLAATEAMFGEPASTIRDVAELTEASPNLIARLLTDIRGDDEFSKLQTKVESHEDRIVAVERKVNQNQVVAPPILKSSYSQGTQTQAKNQTSSILAIVIALTIGMIMLGFFTTASSIGRKKNIKYGTTVNGNEFVVYDDGSIYKVVNGKEETPTNEEAGLVSLMDHAMSKAK